MKKCGFDKYLKVLIGEQNKAMNLCVFSVSSRKANAGKTQSYFLLYLNFQSSEICHLEELWAAVLLGATEILCYCQ